MPTLFNSSQRNKQIERLRKLRADSRPLWGKLDAHNLLPHLMDPILVGLGEYKVANTSQRFFKTAIGKWLVIFVIPKWPKSSPTAPEFDITRYGRKGKDFENDRAQLLELMERFGNATEPAIIPPHPVFGDISWKAWGHLMDKHIEHHCRQFGI